MWRDPSDFARQFDVSRETVERLQVLDEMVQKWNPRINLISRSTIPNVWSRHIADSAQLWRLRPSRATNWLDLGAGAGFPGLVIAAMGEGDGVEMTLVESDTRKSVFLGEAAREMGLSVRVLTDRIEALGPVGADVVSARAVAPLSVLIGYAEKHMRSGGIALFPKGATVHNEIREAEKLWSFEATIHRSITDPAAAIVEVGAVTRE
jgi:16S rRNA (guanine527-N7)-methyltransferase